MPTVSSLVPAPPPKVKETPEGKLEVGGVGGGHKRPGQDTSPVICRMSRRHTSHHSRCGEGGQAPRVRGVLDG